MQRRRNEKFWDKEVKGRKRVFCFPPEKQEGPGRNNRRVQVVSRLCVVVLVTG